MSGRSDGHPVVNEIHAKKARAWSYDLSVLPIFISLSLISKLDHGVR